jgi:hypothetical protein
VAFALKRRQRRQRRRQFAQTIVKAETCENRKKALGVEYSNAATVAESKVKAQSTILLEAVGYCMGVGHQYISASTV